MPIANKGGLNMGRGGRRGGGGEGDEKLGGGVGKRGKTSRVFSPTILIQNQP